MKFVLLLFFVHILATGGSEDEQGLDVASVQKANQASPSETSVQPTIKQLHVQVNGLQQKLDKLTAIKIKRESNSNFIYKKIEDYEKIQTISKNKVDSLEKRLEENVKYSNYIKAGAICVSILSLVLTYVFIRFYIQLFHTN